ncbi:DUF1328 domain-containing protein [Acidisoma sp. S159]|uniref:DUF1328 domain-containing protein n=1 Tax=Acidisoma sp. S159 TaxID=1747225 RepID=UPI00131CC589|nr:DUF1328 domain-containing protein [Acidisoma sp. S159]
MLRWTLTFLVISLAMGLVGFSGYASAAATTARVMFFSAAAMFLVSAALAIFTVQGVFQ